MRYKSILFFLLLAVNSTTICLAMETAKSNAIFEKIESVMKDTDLGLECHVNIHSLAKNLKAKLSDDEFAKISVVILIPEGSTYEAAYLPNSIWLHHVVLVFDNHVFDFFNNNSEKKNSGQEFLDYIYENFFDFRKKYKEKVLTIIPEQYRGFSSLNLIESYRRVKIKCIKVTANHYLNCVMNQALDFYELEKDKTCSAEMIAYDKQKFLLWYKKFFKGVIYKTDTLFLWGDLYDLHWEAIEKHDWDFSIVKRVTDSFDWPELNSMVRRWEQGELTWFIYFSMVCDEEKNKNNQL